jgi:hypothetical protein
LKIFNFRPSPRGGNRLGMFDCEIIEGVTLKAIAVVRRRPNGKLRIFSDFHRLAPDIADNLAEFAGLYAEAQRND